MIHEVDASDISGGAGVEFECDVRVRCNWRFRLGLVLARIGFSLMGFDSTEIRYRPAIEHDGHRAE